MARSTSYTTELRAQLIESLIAAYGTSVTRGEITQYCADNQLPTPWFLLDGAQYKAGRGLYSLSPSAVSAPKPVVTKQEPVAEPALAATVTPITTVKMKRLVTDISDNLVPEKDRTYVPFGFFKDLEAIVSSNQFYPVFITGLSGNGKTFMVEQVCAKLKRECIRVNISIETDEDDLIGSNTLIDGNVVYREGPILLAMKRGAIVILDEIDRGSNKLMCLQAILEGKPYFNKKTGELIHGQPGFNIIATANTKGRGTDDGKFIAAQILDEAFLERFPITHEQEYPTASVERKIILNNMAVVGEVDEDFADKLVSWGEIIRKTYLEGGIDELVSTRRLVHIVRAYGMFKNRLKAIQLCTNRFDAETKAAFLDLYSKVDVKATEQPAADEVAPAEEVPAV
jgi:MoxR-like ATPase